MIVHRIAPCALAAGLLALAGCGEGGPEMSAVEGTLKVKGKPLERIQVEFWPEVDGPRSIGVTDAQGHFTLATDDGKRQGAVVGPHKVVLRDVGILGDKFLGRAGENVDMSKGKKPRVPAAYRDPHRTPLKKEVTPGNCVIELEL